MNSKAYFLILIVFPGYLISQISGIVKDQSTNKPLEGVNIFTSREGTTTNQLGEFNINISEGTKLEFSHIGFQPIIKNAKNNMTIDMMAVALESQEIVIKAGLLDESFQKIPGSISVITKENIRAYGAEHFQILIDQIPNLNWAGGTSRPRYFQIRGIGERSHFFGEGPPNFSVGFVMDDMDLSGLGMVGQLYDLEQIEVFKGPQSSIYGPNAIAGLISLRSSDPVDNFESNISAKFGSDNMYGGSYLINLNLMKNLNVRLTSIYDYSDGFRNNITKNISNSNKRDESFLRLKLSFQPSETIEILTTVIHSDMSNGYDIWTPDNNEDLNTYTDMEGQDSQKTYGSSFRINVGVAENINIVSITSFTKTDLVHAYDGDWADSLYWHDKHGFDPIVEGYEYSFFDQNERSRSNFTQEIRTSLGPLIIGGYFKNLIEEDIASGYLFGGDATEASSKYDLLAKAGYAQINSKISQSINLKFNIRLENNGYNYEGIAEGLNDDWEVIQLPLVKRKTDDSMLGYRLSVNFQKDQSTSYYSSFSQGFKSGGVNQQPYLSNSSRLYQPEFIHNYEIGLKHANERYKTQISGFYGKRKDQQVSVSSQKSEEDPTSFFYYTSNAGSGWILGMEWEHQHKVSERFQLLISLGYLDTWLDKFQFDDNTILREGGEREAAMSPKIIGSFGVHSHFRSNIFTSVKITHKGAYYFSDSHDNKSDPYSLISLTIGKVVENTTIKLWARNILDVRYPVRGFYFSLIPPDFTNQLWKSYGDPRQIGLTVDYKF